MQEFEFCRPENIPDLKEILSVPGARILAGGTDIIPMMRRGTIPVSILVDTSGIPALDFIEDQGDMVVIGSRTTHQRIAESRMIQMTNPALQLAAESIGCIQTRCRGTLGGNIANASPAGDTLPPLLVFDAQVLIQSRERERSVPLADLILGPGQIALDPGEFIHSISFAPLSGKWGAHFIKVGKRSGMAISVVNAAAAMVLDESGLIADVRLALGAVGPVVLRCREAERTLLGKEPSGDVFQEISVKAIAEISPIDDIRSTYRYRAHAAGVIATRALEKAAEKAMRRSQ